MGKVLNEENLEKSEVVKKIEEIEKEEDKGYVKTSMDFKWGTNEMSTEVKTSLDRVRAEKLRTETEIYDAIKRFEWKTGIKITKLDFELTKDLFSPKVKVLLERI